ncbi:amino acid ABC transporter permease [Streptomyces sp. NBC_00083]|uniref:amino acid ABC transporter permease n=1 Tax=Streptomyces sp. NBC_00083 TaxID=2975647 RepID=UPI00225A619B|nr:amino acid ABC transporter permease [Streptomyces sp. NBC_00083]MCX5384638.1 amino acid ABC transporter permease [Streptomyces sp. NBC_00083]
MRPITDTAPPGAAVPDGAREAPPAPDGPASFKVVPARHYARWVAAAAVTVLTAQFVHGLFANPVWEWSVFRDYVLSETIVQAVWVTLQLTAYATVLGFLLGTVLAFMRLSRSPVLQTVAWTYIWIFRSIPMIVQLVFWFNLSALYQELGIGVPFGPVLWSVDSNSIIGTMGAAVIGLTLHQGAYAAEVVRGGVLAVDPGQLEAAAALGIPRLRQIRRIVLPQAMRAILPTAGNEIIGLLKGTSVVYVMAIGELFYQVQVVYGRNGRVIPLLLVATAWYVVLTSLLSIAQYYVERRYARGADRTPPPTPLQRARRFARAVRGAAARPDQPVVPLQRLGDSR